MSLELLGRVLSIAGIVVLLSGMLIQVVVGGLIRRRPILEGAGLVVMAAGLLMPKNVGAGFWELALSGLSEVVILAYAGRVLWRMTNNPPVRKGRPT
jgi:hypothetical protein